MYKLISVLVILASLTHLSRQECQNIGPITRCFNVPPLKEGEPIIVHNYLPRLELTNYTGPLYTGTFERLTRVEQLFLTNCDITSIEENVFCHLNKLKFISISKTKMPDIEKNTFGTSCPLLQIISIQESGVKNIAPESFIHMTNLSTIYLEYCPITTLKKDTFKGLSSLQNLYLKGNNISVIEPGAFNGLDHIKILNLNDNNLSHVPTLELKRLVTLEDLYLSNNEITDFEPKPLLDNLTNLKLFSFYLNKVPCGKLMAIKDDLTRRGVGKQVFQIECMFEPM